MSRASRYFTHSRMRALLSIAEARSGVAGDAARELQRSLSSSLELAAMQREPSLPESLRDETQRERHALVRAAREHARTLECAALRQRATRALLHHDVDDADDAATSAADSASRHNAGSGGSSKDNDGDSNESVNSVYVEIAAGAGGADSADFAHMLAQQYTAFAERRQWRVSRIDESDKRCTLRVDGAHAGAWLLLEKGTHRLVRLSPFNKDRKRHTSFASVTVLPAFEEQERKRVALPASEVRFDTFRASGAGGQHVNTTDSAVRAVHEPTGLVAVAQQSRSQHSNRAAALALLEARVAARAREEAAQRAAQVRAARGVAAFGGDDVVRSITLHPSQRVKCARSQHSGTDAEQLLAGTTLDRWILRAARAVFLPDVAGIDEEHDPEIDDVSDE